MLSADAMTNDSGRLWKFSEGLTDVCIVGVLWFLCSLPIVTVGASTTAMYTVFLRNIRSHEQKQYVRPFFDAFKQSFRESTVLWIIQLVVSAVLGIDVYYYRLRGGRIGLAMEVVILCLLAVVTMIFCYAFPLTALYRNTVKETLIESAQYAFYSLPWSLLALTVSVAVPLLLTKGLWYLVLIAGGVVGIANSYIMVHALKREIPRGHGPAKF
jgi:uncharacterized membrane protein YesL